MADLTSRQRQHLKKLAHHLNPVVHVGKDGISESLRRQVDVALDRHELIKVKLTDSSPLDRDATAEQLPVAVGAFLVQNIGRVFILYRPHPEKPRIELPWATQPPAEVEDEDVGEVADVRAPRPRAGESLLRSVRERGPVGAAISSQRPTPPPRPVFVEPDAVPLPKVEADDSALPAVRPPRGTPKGGVKAKAKARPKPASASKKKKPGPATKRGTRGAKRKT